MSVNVTNGLGLYFATGKKGEFLYNLKKRRVLEQLLLIYEHWTIFNLAEDILLLIYILGISKILIWGQNDAKNNSRAGKVSAIYG